MRSKNVLAWLAAAGAAAVVACSSVSPTQACTDLAKAVCDKAAQCASSVVSEVYGDATTCASRTTSSCEQSLALKDTADTPDFAEKCSVAYATLSCGDALDNVPAADCKRKELGKLSDGSACGTAGQCASSVCQIDGTTGCGKCIEPAAAGAACQSTNDCQDGLVCAAGTSGGVCIAPAASGATCSTKAPIVPCQGGLICNGTTCQTPLAAGSACDPTPGKSLCDGASGYWCTPKGTRCVAVKFAGPNAACGYDSTTGDSHRLHRRRSRRGRPRRVHEHRPEDAPRHVRRRRRRRRSVRCDQRPLLHAARALLERQVHGRRPGDLQVGATARSHCDAGIRVSREPESQPVFVPAIARIISRRTNGRRVASGVSQSRARASGTRSLWKSGVSARVASW